MRNKLLGKALAFALVLATGVATIGVTTNEAEAAKTFTYGQVTGEQAGAIKTIFNPTEYSRMYPDLKDAGIESDDMLWAHFINCGIWEHRQPCASLQIDCYASANADLHRQFGSDMLAYYMYYVSHQGEQAWRSVPTYPGQGREGNTVYALEDFVVGQDAPRAGAVPIQTLSSWQEYLKDNEDAR